MKRLPTTLDKLKTIQDKLAHDAALLRKRREQLDRQQQRLERKAYDEALRQAGEVVAHLGIPLDDLEALEVLLRRGLETDPAGEESRVSVVAEMPHEAIALDGQAHNLNMTIDTEQKEGRR